MTRPHRDGGTLVATVAVLAPAQAALLAHPTTLTIVATLAADTVVTISRWLWLLRRDRKRQHAAATLIRASHGQPGKIVLDPQGGIEIDRYSSTIPGKACHRPLETRSRRQNLR
jgi:hypothetical protein